MLCNRSSTGNRKSNECTVVTSVQWKGQQKKIQHSVKFTLFALWLFEVTGVCCQWDIGVAKISDIDCCHIEYLPLYVHAHIY